MNDDNTFGGTQVSPEATMALAQYRERFRSLWQDIKDDRAVYATTSGYKSVACLFEAWLYLSHSVSVQASLCACRIQTDAAIIAVHCNDGKDWLCQDCTRLVRAG